jgi:glutathione S-transferase
VRHDFIRQQYCDGMLTLYHHPVCPHSRFVRLALSEYGLPVQLVGERVWERREGLLLLNPAGTVPVLVVEGITPAPGAAIIAEYLDEVYGSELGDRRLLPPDTRLRIEVRRLTSWFNDKFFADVSGPLTKERYRQYMPPEAGGGSPDRAVLREAREILPDHLAYIGLMLSQHDWLASDQLSYADLAAAAHLSAAEYLGDMPWPEDETVKRWYARMQSRPSFQAMLAEAWRGFVRQRN